MRRIFFSLFLGFILFPEILAFQVNGSSISGRITDHEDNPVTGAAISITGTQHGVLSDEYGFYTIAELKDGYHVINISFLGYKSIRRELNLSGKAVINIQLVPLLYSTGEVIVNAIQGRQPNSACIFNNRRGAYQKTKRRSGYTLPACNDTFTG